MDCITFNDKGALWNFYLMHLTISMNIIKTSVPIMGRGTALEVWIWCVWMRSILYNCTPIGLEAALGLLFALIQISLGSFEKAREKLTTHTHWSVPMSSDPLPIA